MLPLAILIVELRKQRKMTQAQLAERLNVAPTYLSAVENGLKPASNHLIQGVIDVLATTERERQRVHESVRVSTLSRKLPGDLPTSAYPYIAALWDAFPDFVEEDYQALHAVLRAIRTAPSRGLSSVEE